MIGKEINLEEMLAFREKRVSLQKKMQAREKQPVISFSLNIPGPVKTNEKIRKAFDLGKEELIKNLKQAGIPSGGVIEIHEKCGDELILSASGPAEKIKDITVEIEETHPLGRLFDMDVIDTDGNKLSRPVYRTCLICGKQAQECARSRTHSVQELQNAVEKLLDDHLPHSSGQAR